MKKLLIVCGLLLTLSEARAAGRYVVVAHDPASHLDGGMQPWGARP